MHRYRFGTVGSLERRAIPVARATTMKHDSEPNRSNNLIPAAFANEERMGAYGNALNTTERERERVHARSNRMIESRKREPQIGKWQLCTCAFVVERGRVAKKSLKGRVETPPCCGPPLKGNWTGCLAMQTRCYQADFVCVTVRNESSVTGNPFPGIQPIGSSSSSSPPPHSFRCSTISPWPGYTREKTCSQAARFDLNGREMDRKRRKGRKSCTIKLRGELGWLRKERRRIEGGRISFLLSPFLD